VLALTARIDFSYYAFIYNDLVFKTIEKRLGKNNAAVFARAATAGGQRFPVHVSVRFSLEVVRLLIDLELNSGEAIVNRPTKLWQSRYEGV
jgi:hypothetical protein